MALKLRSDVRNLRDWGVSPVGAYETELLRPNPNVRFAYRVSQATRESARIQAQCWLDSHNIYRQFAYQSPDDIRDSNSQSVYVYFHIKGVQD